MPTAKMISFRKFTHIFPYLEGNKTILTPAGKWDSIVEIKFLETPCKYPKVKERKKQKFYMFVGELYRLSGFCSFIISEDNLSAKVKFSFLISENAKFIIKKYRKEIDMGIYRL